MKRNYLCGLLLVLLALPAMAAQSPDVTELATGWRMSSAQNVSGPDAQVSQPTFDASNNKFLVSGQASLIMNPPSAWAVARRDAPKVAELCWTHGFAAGPKGRFAPFLPYFWG